MGKEVSGEGSEWGRKWVGKEVSGEGSGAGCFWTDRGQMSFAHFII